jgi:hypothetical protein
MAESIASIISEDCRYEQDEHEQVNIERQKALLGKESSREQQAVARKEKAYKQARFSINDRRDSQPSKMGYELDKCFHYSHCITVYLLKRGILEVLVTP